MAGGDRAGAGGMRDIQRSPPARPPDHVGLDYRYYMEKVRKDRFDLSQDDIKPHFELSNMINGMFWAAGELYGLDFKENTGTVPVWHPDIRTYEVTNRSDGSKVGLFYMDPYARAGKRSGAWHSAFRARVGLLGDEIVLNSNHNNFVKPAPGGPVLINLDDAETLFHEFGHAIQICWSTCAIRPSPERSATSSNNRAR